MRTITRHRPYDSPRGDTQATCDLCGTRFYRSELRRNRSGWLVCREDADERDPVTLSELIARDACHRPPMPPNGGGNYTYPISAIEEFGIDYSTSPPTWVTPGSFPDGSIVSDLDGLLIVSDVDGEPIVSDV